MAAEPAAGAAGGSFVLRRATIVDGSGAQRFGGDVLVRDGRIAEIADHGSIEASGVPEVDLAGLVLAPGFIDIHTHYDAQVLWDPDLTPSSWHGVTTVVMGNCGFSIAPTAADGREAIIGTLENVEDMEPEALHQGIRWEFETFPEYLDLLDGLPKRLNVAAMIGHSALRLFVMGEEALDRAATPAEVTAMSEIVIAALEAGAAGFATSRSGSHVGHLAKPVASRVADLDELLALVGAADLAGRGVVQLAAGSGLEEVARIAARTQRPVTWSALLTGRYDPVTALEMVEATSALGSHVWPQISCRPLVLQLTLLEPRGLASLSSFAEVLALPTAERASKYQDPDWLKRARTEMSTRWGSRWGSISIDGSAADPSLADRTLAELGDERGQHPFDVMVAVALQDDLSTRFTFTLMNDDEAELGALLRDERTLLGLSDAGAHASQLCDACFSTHLLGHWVRDVDAVDLERAIWRLSGQPASIFGFSDRGLVRPGYVADLVAFDPARITPGERRRVPDLPGGGERLVVDAIGVEHVWVAGTPIVRDGAAVDDATPGELLRSCSPERSGAR